MEDMVEGMPAAEYHADPCETPSLSSSMAHKLLSKSPAHAYLAHPRLGGHVSEPSDTLDRGTVIHELVLGTVGGIVALEHDNYRTKVAREERDVARAKGKVPVLAKEMAPLKLAADAIKEGIRKHGIDLDGQSEVTAFWSERSAAGPVQCRARFDHLVDSRIYDLKTTRSASPRDIAKSVESYGYATQSVAYLRALEANRPELVGRTSYRWIFCELEPPYAVTIAEPSGGLEALGNMRWLRAVEMWGRCLKNDRWPPYSEATVLVEPMPWALDREFEHKEAT